jgi:hypothetical protein
MNEPTPEAPVALPLKGGEPAPSERLRARERLASADWLASQSAPPAARRSRFRGGRSLAWFASHWVATRDVKRA